MDQPTSDSFIPRITKPQTSPPNPIFLFVVAALIIGGVGGFFGGQYFMPTPEPTPQSEGYELVKTSELFLPLEVLRNPVHYQWGTSSQGILVEKTDSYIILEAQGERATFALVNYTNFFGPEETETGGLKPRNLEDIPLGSKLLGGAFVEVIGEKIRLLARGFKVRSLGEE